MTEYRDNSKAMLRKWETGIEKAITLATLELEKEARRLTSLKVGVAKTNYGNAVGHRSRPGEPPYIETGTLTKSISHETGKDGTYFYGRVGTKHDYGWFLEVGTRNMAPRPWLRPALDNTTPRIRALLGKAFRASIGGSMA